jgi:hypothetical protein
MRRFNLIEIHEQSWFPEKLREAVTDILQTLLNFAGYVVIVAPLLRRVLRETGSHYVVDLCAGGGGPWLPLSTVLKAEVVSIRLTDKFPNGAARERLRAVPDLPIEYLGQSIDAEHVPRGLPGFRTLFNCFHHFEPDRAMAILRNAAEQGEGLAVFEIARRSFTAICATCMMAVGTFLLVPFVRPFRLSLVLWTYLIPVLPIIMWLDGIVSCLRAYTPSELLQLARNSVSSAYEWQVGMVTGHLFPLTVTYLIGSPRPQGGRGAKIEKSRVTSHALQFTASEKEGYAQPS